MSRRPIGTGLDFGRVALAIAAVAAVAVIGALIWLEVSAQPRSASFHYVDQAERAQEVQYAIWGAGGIVLALLLWLQIALIRAVFRIARATEETAALLRLKSSTGAQGMGV